MTLQQMQALKHWHVAHKELCPVELHALDGVLAAWVFGWMGQPAALILWWPGLALTCALLYFAPVLYVCARRTLHHRGVLRCDWLHLLSPPR